MFRSSTLKQKIFSFALPFVLVWVWVACVAICAEVSEHHKISGYEKVTNNKSLCYNLHCSESCSVSSIPAAFQESQKISAPEIVADATTFPAFQFTVISAKVFASDINLHSPPKIVFPRFLRLQNFRI